MTDFEQLKKVDKDCGVDVLRVWLFDLPELSYLSSVNIVQQQNDIKDFERSKDMMEKEAMLTVDGKSKEIREAEVSKKLSENNAYQGAKTVLRTEYIALETLKAQRDYYDKMFKVVKDELYSKRRMQELDITRDIKKEVASEFKVIKEA